MSAFHPLQTLAKSLMPSAMRCFLVLIHGAFTAAVQLAPEVDAHGFYTTRWVVAFDKQNAVRKAFQSARRELNQWSDVRDGLVQVEMEAEKVEAGSWWRWLKGGRGGFSFYGDE
jgi:hypothetical protein